MTGLHRACCCTSEPCGGCDWSVLNLTWVGTLRFECHLCDCPDPGPGDLYELDVALRIVEAQFTGAVSFGACVWTGETVTFVWDYVACGDEPAAEFELRCQVSILHVGAGVWRVFVAFSALYVNNLGPVVPIAEHTYESDDVGTSECPYVGTYSLVASSIYLTPAPFPCPEDPNHWLAWFTEASYPSTITLNV